MTVCQVLECIHNSREEKAVCLDEAEISSKGQCLRFKTDFSYLTEQFRNRHMVTARHIEAQSFENLVLMHEKKLRIIMRGGIPTKLLVRSERDTLRNYGILERNGRLLEVTARAEAILESNGG